MLVKSCISSESSSVILITVGLLNPLVWSISNGQNLGPSKWALLYAVCLRLKVLESSFGENFFLSLLSVVVGIASWMHGGCVCLFDRYLKREVSIVTILYVITRKCNTYEFVLHLLLN